MIFVDIDCTRKAKTVFLSKTRSNMTHPLTLFKFCPKCGSTHFEERNAKAKVCTDCGFVYYFNPSSAVVALIINKQGELLVTRRANAPAKGTMDLVGGFVDSDETVEESVAREVMEETEMTVTSTNYLFSIPNIYPYKGFEVHTTDLFFRCEVDDYTKFVPHDDVNQLFYVPLAELDASQFGLRSIKQGIKQLIDMKKKHSHNNLLTILLTLLMCCPLLPGLSTPAVAQSSWQTSPKASYTQAAAAFSREKKGAYETLKKHLQKYPDSPYKNTVFAMLGAIRAQEGQYSEAADWFAKSQLKQLPRNQRQYLSLMAGISMIQENKLDDAETVLKRMMKYGHDYEPDYTYYIGYINYVRGKYADAAALFELLVDDASYGEIVPYYIGEMALVNKEYDKAYTTASDFLNNYPESSERSENYRIKGMAAYQLNKLAETMSSLKSYRQKTQKPRLDAMYIYGLAAYKNSDYALALPLFTESTKSNDTALVAYSYLQSGLCLLELNRKEEAQLAFKKASKKGPKGVAEKAQYNYAVAIQAASPKDTKAWIPLMSGFLTQYPQTVYKDQINEYLADGYIVEEDYAQALKHVNRIVNPNQKMQFAKADVLVEMAAEAINKKQYRLASNYLKEVKTVRGINPNAALKGRYWQGEIYQKKGNSELAKKAYINYLKSQPAKTDKLRARALYNLGYCTFNAKDYDQAKAYFSAFLALPQSKDRFSKADAYNRLGDCAFYKREFAQADQEYVQAAKLASKETTAYAWYQQGIIAGLQQNFQMKELLMHRVRTQYPTSAQASPAYYQEARALVDQKKSEQAIQVFQGLMTIDKTSQWGRKAAAEIALLYYQDKNYAKAIEGYTHVLITYPGTDEATLALQDLRSIYVDKNQVGAFAELVKTLPNVKAISATEQDSLLFVAAKSCYLRKEWDQATKSFKQFIKKIPSGDQNTESLYYLYKIMQRKGNVQAQVNWLKQLSHKADNRYTIETWDALAHLYEKQKKYNDAALAYEQLSKRTAHLSEEANRYQAALLGIVTNGYTAGRYPLVISNARVLLKRNGLTKAVHTKISYQLAKSLLKNRQNKEALSEFSVLAKNTDNIYGAEAKFIVAHLYYTTHQTDRAEATIQDFISKGTPHNYWLARAMILEVDILTDKGDLLNAKGYLEGLRDGYQGDDDISKMVLLRMDKLTALNKEKKIGQAKKKEVSI